MSQAETISELLLSINENIDYLQTSQEYCTKQIKKVNKKLSIVNSMDSRITIAQDTADLARSEIAASNDGGEIE